MALRAVPTKTALLLLLAAAACCSWADGFFPGASLIGCATPPPGTPSNEADDGNAFRAALVPLLVSLPSAAAATGFASLRSAGDGHRAHAFGLCFFGEHDDEGCLVCLTTAAAAVVEGCVVNGTLRAAVWREGCLLAYTDDDDWRDQALAEPHEQSPGKKALSVLFYALAAVGAVAIVLLLCAFVAAFMIARTLVHHSAAGHAAAGGQGGEGITAYVVASNGQSPLWSLAVQMRFY